MLDGGRLEVKAEALELVVGVPACLEGSSLCLYSTSSMILCEAGFMGSNSGSKVASLRLKEISKLKGRSVLLIFANFCNNRSYKNGRPEELKAYLKVCRIGHKITSRVSCAVRLYFRASVTVVFRC